MTNSRNARPSEITISIAARRTGLSPSRVRRYIRRELVDGALIEADLTCLRRIRRLTDLGINVAGVEVILQMRRRIEALQAKVARLEVEGRSGTSSARS
jgi:DNA-binding transcriptional MerR regulator